MVERRETVAGRQGGRWYLEGGEDGRGKWEGVGVAGTWESKEGVAGMVEEVMVGLDLGFFFGKDRERGDFVFLP